jgi:hypothetical protein
MIVCLMDLFQKYGAEECVEMYLRKELPEEEMQFCHGALSPTRVLYASNMMLLKAIEELNERLKESSLAHL